MLFSMILGVSAVLMARAGTRLTTVVAALRVDVGLDPSVDVGYEVIEGSGEGVLSFEVVRPNLVQLMSRQLESLESAFLRRPTLLIPAPDTGFRGIGVDAELVAL